MKKPAALRMYDELEADLDVLEKQLRDKSVGQSDPNIYDWCSAHLSLVDLLRSKAKMGRQMEKTSWLCLLYFVMTAVLVVLNAWVV